MTYERAIEILDPEHRERYGSIEVVNEACRMGMKTLQFMAGVVRCKDCKYWGDEDGKTQGEDGLYFARCQRHNYPVGHKHIGWSPKENDFCSRGERKDDDKF